MKPAQHRDAVRLVVTNLRQDGALRVAVPDLWASVDRLIDSTSDVDALRANRLHLLAARRWRERGIDVPGELVEAERLAVLVSFVLPDVLARVRAAYDGPLVVHKGPEVALRYPDPLLRPYIDIDLLIPTRPRRRARSSRPGFSRWGIRSSTRSRRTSFHSSGRACHCSSRCTRT